MGSDLERKIKASLVKGLKMKYNRSMYLTDNSKITYHPFYSHSVAKCGKDAYFSNWYDCTFEVDGITYHTTEQYMMAQKAKVFHDNEIYEKIMSENSPSKYKALGRQVKNFDPATWDEVKYDIVLKGCMAKFEQNSELRDHLLSTGNSVLIEASPSDCIWGVGLAIDDFNVKDPTMWRGTNLLGFALMETRDYLK